MRFDFRVEQFFGASGNTVSLVIWGHAARAEVIPYEPNLDVNLDRKKFNLTMRAPHHVHTRDPP
jgi:hypothetical protein